MANYERHQYSGNAVTTTVGAIAGTGAITPTLADSTGWPDGSTGPFVAVINEGQADEEKVLVTSRASAVLTIGASGRGYDGTTAATHSGTPTIKHCYSARDANEANLLVYTLANGTSGRPLLGGGAATMPAYGQVDTGGIADNAVTAAKVAAAVAGSGLTGGAGSALAVGAGTYITVNANDITIDLAGLLAAIVGNGLDVSGTTLVVDETELSVTTLLNLLLTTRGDIITRGATLPQRLALGTSGYFLKSDGTDAVWATLPNDVGGNIIWGSWTVAPTGFSLFSATVTGAQSTYPETWSNTPTGWHSGSDLVLPDVRGLSPAIYKSTDADYDAIGDTGGAKTHTPAGHTHALSANGWADLSQDVSSNWMRWRSTSATAFTATHTTVGIDVDTVTGSHSNGIQLGGATDSGADAAFDTRDPWVTFNAAIRLK